MKSFKSYVLEASGQSMVCPHCGKAETHIEFAGETKSGLPKSYRVCDNGGCAKSGEKQNITGLPKKKNGISH